MSRKSLQQFYAEHQGKFSDKWSLYLVEYERVFERYRDRAVRLLEIGVQNGGSLDIWAKYFGSAVSLIGCDVNPDCAKLRYDDKRISVVIGDAGSTAVYEEILDHSAEFEIIIDDGSHRSSDIVKAFSLYFPKLADGGVFVVEDLHCSYWEQFEGGLFDPYSSMAFFKRLADVVSHEHWGVSKQRSDILRGIFSKYGCEMASDSLAQIHSVEFVNSMCIIRKASDEQNTLGHRVVAGSEEVVVPGLMQWNGQSCRFDTVNDQSRNKWSARQSPPDEDVERLEHALVESEKCTAELKQRDVKFQEEVIALRQNYAELEQQYSGLRQECAAIRQENIAMRESSIWKFTAPIRFVADKGKRVAGRLRGGALSISPAASTNAGSPVLSVNGRGGLRASVLRRGHQLYREHMKGTRLGRWIGQQVLKRGMVNITELQISTFAPDCAAPRSRQGDSTPELDALVPGFHLSPPLNLEVSERLSIRSHINVLLPSLRPKDMSGGPNTALLLAALLVEKGEYVRLIACDAATKGEERALLDHMDRLLRRPVLRDRIELVDAFDRSRPTPIGANDLFFATAWWTAQIAKYAVKQTAHKTFIYLIQDFEPILHEGSTFQARALETYGLPHIPVINTRLLLDHLVKEGAGRYADPEFAANALFFEPALDRSYYFPDASSGRKGEKKVLLFYARPTMARRNLFEMGVVALRQAVASGVLDKDNWEIWGMGEKLSPVPLGKGMFLNPLPWMSYEEYAQRVRTADLLLSLMLSPHPSYPPLEMAASGKLVVTNSFSVKTEDRLKVLSPNILTAEPSPEGIAAALEKAAGRINAGLPSYDPSGNVGLPGSWDESLASITPSLLEQIHGIRKEPLDAEGPATTGYPATPTTDYERYRRARLAQRRREGGYHQEPGLLSFVTSAYNTAPSFLEELGSSLFLQDGGVNFEWFILDNGSTDPATRRTLEELGRHAAVRLERVEENLGIIGGMRYCLERARGRYILPLDSDDIIEPDCVHVLTRCIQENGYPALLYSDEDKLGGGHFGSPYFKPDWDPVLFLHSCYIAHLCAIDRKLALELGLYSDNSSEGCHDWDSFTRFMNAGYVPFHVPDVLYSWRLHEASTSGNIGSKPYVAASHRATLERALRNRRSANLELVNSPLFSSGVDWWYKRRRDVPVSYVYFKIIPGRNSAKPTRYVPSEAIPIDLGKSDSVRRLLEAVGASECEFVHVCWSGVEPDDDEWQWDAAGLLELFPDAIMVGGVLHDGKHIIGGPCVFGFGNGFDCPDRGRLLSDPGYGATMWKARSVSALSSGHCVIRRDFLLSAAETLLAEEVEMQMLGPWLGGMAAEAGKRVIYSPFMRAKAVTPPEVNATVHSKAEFLSRFWTRIPDNRVYSARLGLTAETAYLGVDSTENRRHLARLQSALLPYPDWLEKHSARRLKAYPVPNTPASMTLMTTVYERTDIEFLDSLAESVLAQTLRPAQWVIVVHGPVAEEKLDHISKNSSEWNAEVYVNAEPLGIMGAMHVALQKAEGEYVVPVDADDVLTQDAIQILTACVAAYEGPDLVFSDEDLLIDGQPTSPYYRPGFDPILNLDSSYIWHLCAIKREVAIALGLYTDPGSTWCHDWDSVMRVINAQGRIEHIPEVLYHWRVHQESTTNNSTGSQRSLESVRHLLKGQIARTERPQNFEVSTWPINRGAPEVYIARQSKEVPQLLWIGDVLTQSISEWDDDAILMFSAKGVLVDSRDVAVEVARLFELHPYVGAVGGIVEGPDDLVVDACYFLNHGVLESPWVGKHTDYAGPYALALKPQIVTITGNSLAFFRVSALSQAGLWPIEEKELSPEFLCWQLASKNWNIAFSPLVRGRVGSEFRVKSASLRPPIDYQEGRGSLVRYGLARSHSLEF